MASMPLPSRPLAALAAVPVTLLMALSGCASSTSSSAGGSSGPRAQATSSSDVLEAELPNPRLAISHESGVWVLDASSLQVVGEAASSGFVRLNPAGDGRHVLVSSGAEFRALDLGAWTDTHGDHAHHYSTTPTLTDITFPAEEPGHVVTHDDQTALFADGSGVVDVFDPHDLADGKPTATRHTSAEPHHGVAVPLARGGLLVSAGTTERRTGVLVLDEDRRTVASTDDCPGVHGEAVVAGAVVVGCEDGLVVYRDGTLRKVDSPTAYGRIGNQAGTPLSAVVLGDYKSDPDAELERPERVSLVDTRTGRLRLVDLGTSYTFRSLGRGPRGTALVLGTDGNLHVIDDETAKVTTKIPVLQPWTEPQEWQQPRPALFTLGSKAYVTEPAHNKIHTVDLRAQQVVATADLPGTPNELSGVVG